MRCAHSILLLRVKTRCACNKQRFCALYYTCRILSLEILPCILHGVSLVYHTIKSARNLMVLCLYFPGTLCHFNSALFKYKLSKPTVFFSAKFLCSISLLNKLKFAYLKYGRYIFLIHSQFLPYLLL